MMVVTWAPLLLGKVQLGNPSTKILKMHRKGLEYRDMASIEEREGSATHTLVKMAKEVEHGDLTKKKHSQ